MIKYLEKEIVKNTRNEETNKRKKHGNHHGKEKISTEDAWMLIGIVESIKSLL